MNIPFIYKYKPKRLDDFELDKNIICSIKSLININNLNILLVGNSGSGKTTIIDAIINEYYDLDFDRSNILEINNLKEQGIQYYRNELKTFCQTPSTILHKKKFIVLDDIDFINEQSQQVFRNCIDKYSHNVHFISSCINTQKVIDSLQSRKIIIKLPAISQNNMKNILQSIKESEKLIISEECKNKIIRLSNCSIRIMINYLEKLKILNLPITESLIDNICSNISYHVFDKYTNFILDGKLLQGIKIFYDLYDAGYSAMDIYDNYFIYIKITDIIKDDIVKYKIIKLLCYYITVFYNIHEDEIELANFTNNIIKIVNNPLNSQEFD
jgi:replication factor C subunit 2/4